MENVSRLVGYFESPNDGACRGVARRDVGLKTNSGDFVRVIVGRAKVSHGRLLAGATPAPDVRMIPSPAGLAKKESNV